MLFDTFDETTRNRLIIALAQKYACDETQLAVESAIMADWKSTIEAYENSQATLEDVKNIVPINPINLP